MLDDLNLTDYIVTPLNDAEIAELRLRCDRPISEPIVRLLQTLGMPQNVCFQLPQDDGGFLAHQQGVPPEFCVFLRDDNEDSAYALDASGALFQFDFERRRVTRHPQTLAQFLMPRINPTPGSKHAAWHVQLGFQTNDEPNVLAALMEAYRLTHLSEWIYVGTSPAAVVSHRLECMSPDGPVRISRLMYSDWEAPLYSFNRRIPPAEIPQSKAVFRRLAKADLGFGLCNYGILDMPLVDDDDDE